MSQVWLITGSSRGLGRAFTLAALDAGHSVTATARNVTDIGDLWQKYGDRVLPAALDVTNESQATAAIQDTIKKFG
jgi:NADP-dependent 3-hydroxy acid dehydrogenase YdfG